MFCGWGGSLRRAVEYGNVLLTGDEKTALGILVWDVTSVQASFADENTEVLTAFLEVTAAANAMWNSGNHTELMLPHIAKDAGMDLAATAETMATFLFPSVGSQLGDSWLGGSGEAVLKGVADVFVASGDIPSARGSYANAINTGPLEAVANKTIHRYMGK
jgi:taurine transport system substrate-binding protein